MSRTALLQRDIYPPDLLDLCEREFSALCAVARRNVGNDLEVVINVQPDAPPETADEFLNFLLCAALERRFKG